MTRKAERPAVFEPEFRDDLRYRVTADRKTALRIFELIEAALRDPFEGVGKPEPLRFALAGCWSRRITQEHRLIYSVTDDRISFMQARSTDPRCGILSQRAAGDVRKIAMIIGNVRLVALLLAAAVLFAQDGAKAVFEVASVKPSGARVGTPGIRFPPGDRVIATHLPLKSLIAVAWNTEWRHVFGGPSWLESDIWDIDARAGREASREEKRVMLQSLLEERFHLRLHKETRELPAFILRMAGPDAALPGLKPSASGSCRNIDPAQPLPGGDTPFCGMFSTTTGQPSGPAPSIVRFQGFSVSGGGLARALTPLLDRDVVDETGLTGTFDVTFEYAPERPGTPGQSPDEAAPPIVTALRTQLGMKLESGKHAVDVYVIDHVEKPDQN